MCLRKQLFFPFFIQLGSEHSNISLAIDAQVFSGRDGFAAMEAVEEHGCVLLRGGQSGLPDEAI